METLTLALTLVLGAALPLGWLAARQRRGTTLVSVALWESLAIVSIGLVELLARAVPDGQADRWIGPARWFVACATFCAPMARLGARRPHQNAWQLVVASLWGVLALPAAEVFVLQPGQAFEIHAARGAFLWALLAGRLADALPTRSWLSGLTAVLAQVLLVGQHLPGIDRYWDAAPSTANRCVVGALTLLVAAQILSVRIRTAPHHRPGLTGVWLDFRDQFGAWWALRLLARVNFAAAQAPWPVYLHWFGFRRDDRASHESPRRTPENDQPLLRRAECVTADLTDEQLNALRQTLANVLRRFVSPHWIGGRLGSIPLD